MLLRWLHFAAFASQFSTFLSSRIQFSELNDGARESQEVIYDEQSQQPGRTQQPLSPIQRPRKPGPSQRPQLLRATDRGLGKQLPRSNGVSDLLAAAADDVENALHVVDNPSHPPPGHKALTRQNVTGFFDPITEDVFGLEGCQPSLHWKINPDDVRKCVGQEVDWSKAKPREWYFLSDKALVLGVGAHAIGLMVKFKLQLSRLGFDCLGTQVAIKIAAKDSAKENYTKLEQFSSDSIVGVYQIADPPFFDASLLGIDGENLAEAFIPRKDVKKYSRKIDVIRRVTWKDSYTNRHDRVKCIAMELGDVDLEKFAQFENPRQISETKYWRSSQVASVQSVAVIARDVLQALGELHNRDYAHADVKPSNILLMCNPRLNAAEPGDLWSLGQHPELLATCRAKLADLETACPIWSMSGSCSGRKIGTELFHSPSLVAGRQKRSRKDDLWALGLTLLSLVLNGKDRKMLWELIVERGEFPDQESQHIDAWVPSTHRELVPLFKHLMFPEPAANPKTVTKEAKEMAEELMLLIPVRRRPPSENILEISNQARHCWSQALAMPELERGMVRELNCESCAPSLALPKLGGAST